MRTRSGIVIAVPVIAVLVWGELEHWRAARRGMGNWPSSGRSWPPAA